MTEYTIPNNLPPAALADFTHTCHVCGATVTVQASVSLPHTCRVETE